MHQKLRAIAGRNSAGTPPEGREASVEYVRHTRVRCAVNRSTSGKCSSGMLVNNSQGPNAHACVRFAAHSSGRGISGSVSSRMISCGTGRFLHVAFEAGLERRFRRNWAIDTSRPI